MFAILAIPLALLQLTREKVRLLIALAGISFAVVLMFMQLGFRNALFESAVSFHIELQGDIFLVSPQSNALIAMQSFSRRRLVQAMSIDGVESVSPIYLSFALWKNPNPAPDPNRGRTRSIMVVGIRPDDQVFQLPGVTSNIDQIKLEDVVLFDDASRPEFGDIAKMFSTGQTVETEVRNRRVRVGGLFRLGASFGADGNLITSDLNFLRIFDRANKGLIDIGLIKVKPGVNPREVWQQLQQVIPGEYKALKNEKLARNGYIKGDVVVYLREGFVESERLYWAESTAIGFIFTLGTAMGFVVGTVIVYQILYTDVTDHLAEYATLKAMGYRNLYLEGVVLQEALILSLLGFLPGFLLCIGLYDLTRRATSLPMQMSLELATTVLVLTVVMCVISGAIAVRKVQAADPADIF